MGRKRTLSEAEIAQREEARKNELRRRARNTRQGVDGSWDGFAGSVITEAADPNSQRVPKTVDFTLPGEEEGPLRSRPSEESTATSTKLGRPPLPPVCVLLSISLSSFSL